MFAAVLLVCSTVFVPHAAAQAPDAEATEEAAETEEEPRADAARFITLASDEWPDFTAGETGTIELELEVSSESNVVSFDQTGDSAMVRVTSHANSGVRFDTGDGVLDDEILVSLDLSGAGTGTVTAAVPYVVSSRVKARTYEFTIDVTAPVIVDGAPTIDAGRITVEARVDTPMTVKYIVLALLAFAIFMFVVEWVRVDVVAIIMMVTLPLLNLLSSRDTFTGLSSNAVIAIIGVMIVSCGLNKVGLVSRVVKPVINAAGKSPRRLMIYLSGLIALISSVMQNTGAAVLFLPGIRHATKVMRIPLARVLMPIGMAAILGGTMTMIGTSPLILLNDILPEGVEKFGLLELTPIGLALVVCGILYFSTFGMRFLRKISDAQTERAEDKSTGSYDIDLHTLYEEVQGPYEIRVPSDWQQKDLADTVVGVRRGLQVNIVAIAGTGGLVDVAPAPDVKIEPGKNLCVFGLESRVKEFAEEYGFQILEKPFRFRDLFNPAVAGTAEAAVSPRSGVVGATIGDVGFRKTYGVSVLAVCREGKTYYKEMADIPLQAGDALLLHSTWEHFHVLQEAHQNFMIVEPFDAEDIQKPGKSTAAVICFVVALTLMLISSFYFQKKPYNPIPLSVCLMTGALGMVLTRVISIQEAYRSVDWRTVFLLGGLIPLGMAVDRTGTAEWIATSVVGALGDSVSPLLLIVVLALLANVFCLVISNVGACTLLVPLGAAMAMQIGMDPRVAAIVVGIGVSNSFLLPTHQVNALYMGPGGYRTKDYMKIGGIMSIIYNVVVISMVYFFYL